MSATITTLDAFMKDNYGPGSKRVQKLLYKDFPFLGYIKKNVGVESGSGRRLIAPCVYGSAQGLSSGFTPGRTAASATGGNTKSQDWNVVWGEYFAFCDISDKLMKLSAGSGSYLDTVALEIDSLYTSWSMTFSKYLLSSSARNLGSFTESSGVCTLVNSDDVVNYKIGMLVNASANDGSATGHALLGSGSIGYIIGVNQNVGTFTVSATDGGSAGTPSGWTGTMYAFRYGDFGGTASPNTVCQGFGDWCPASDPSATLYNGVDRTQDIIALSGVRMTAAEIAGLSLESRIKRLVTRMANRGFGAPKVVFVNPEKWQDLADSYEQRAIASDRIGTVGTFGYKAIKVVAGGTEVDVMTDRFVGPTDVLALGDPDSFTLNTPEEFPAVVKGDGLDMLRKVGSNDYEHRLGAYPAVMASPGYLGRTTAP